jgi:hypothetical protein
MEEIRTNLFTAKDMFNAATARPLKSVAGQVLTIVGIWVAERVDLNGEIQVVANLKTDDGSIYGTISETVIRSVTALPEMLEAEGQIAVKVEERPGKQGRSYLVLTLA